jgi:hypothetical protein
MELRDVVRKLNNSIKRNLEQKDFSIDEGVSELVKDVPQFLKLNIRGMQKTISILTESMEMDFQILHILSFLYPFWKCIAMR